MSPSEGVAGQVLVYDRIAHNRRKTWFLVAFAVAALAPFVLGISWAVAASVVMRLSPEAGRARAQARMTELILQHTRADGRERDQAIIDLERRVEEQRERAATLQRENSTLRMKLMPVLAAALISALVLLFWSIASSPTSRLLVQAGARPAVQAEAEAQRVLENLAIGAGLPVPKLYVIESSAPNAFAAGMHPEHAVVAVTRGALGLLDRRELEGVFAHELSHIGNHDIRLNTIVATIALFLRIPYLMFRREMSGPSQRSGTIWWRLAISPFGLYVFLIAPLAAALIRAAVSREREFLADADAALLTRYPEGLLRALAKIGGAGSAQTASTAAFEHFYFANPAEPGRSWFIGRMMATHPPLADRIQRLAGYEGDSALAGLERAVQDGRKYIQDHPVVELDQTLAPPARDELSALNQGNVMGRVYRVASDEPVSVYEMSNLKSCRVATVEPGALIVGFDDPGPMCQVNTADQTFGYIPRSVVLTPVDDLIPAEVYDPQLRAAAEARLARATAAERIPPLPKAGLTTRQVMIALSFGVAVFAGMLLLLVEFGGR